MLITAGLVVVTLLATLLLAFWWRRECRHDNTPVTPHVLWFSVLLGLIAVVLFLSAGIQSGTLQLLKDNQQFKPQAKELIEGGSLEQLDKEQLPLLGLIHALQTRLVHHSSAAGWSALSRLYMELGARAGLEPRQVESINQMALEAADNAQRLAPGDQQIELLLAQAVIMANQGRLNERAWALLDAFVKAHPKHDGAWLMFAMAAVKNQQYNVAEYAFRVLLQHHSDDRMTELLEKSLAKVKQDAKRANYFGQITVEVARGANSEAQAGGTLFVFVQQKGASGQPLAAKRVLLDHFPQEIVLTATDWLQGFPDVQTSLVVGGRYATGSNASVGDSGASVEVDLKQKDNGLSASLLLP